MKKLLLVAFSLATFITNAQDITFGVKAGANFASIGGDDGKDLDGFTSFLIGATVEIPVSDTFSIQPEVLYSGQGFTLDGIVEDVPLSSGGVEDIAYETTGRFDYLNIPIIAKFYLSEGLSLEAGPQIGFLLNSKYDAGGITLESGQFAAETNNLIRESNKVDYGFNLGAGYQLNSGLNFNIRYYLVLADIPKGDTDGFKNNVFQVAVGYNF
jgi:hypothetical protein